MALGKTTYVFDIEAQGPVKPLKVVDLGEVFDLRWVDVEYGEAPEATPVASFERCRRFKHCGGAIAWARRKIFHGDLFGESVEMRTMHVSQVGTELREQEVGVRDITLAGFRRWDNYDKDHRSNREMGLTLGKPERKCRAGRE